MKAQKYKFIIVIFTVWGILSGCSNGKTVKDELRKEITTLLSDKKATVGVAVLADGKEVFSLNDSIHYPLLSVFKFHIALAVLDHMDKYSTSLDSVLFIESSRLLPGTYSPLRDENPGQNVKISLAELLKYSVSYSDNNACDILIDYAGGISAINQYIQNLGIKETFLSANEELMHEKTENQYLNWSTPSSAVQLLEILFEKDLFSEYYKDYLIRIMTETTTGKDKLKGLLPKDIIVGHKTGSSTRTEENIKIADNDMGFVYMPDGRLYFIAVFVKDSKEDDSTNASIIADISEIIYRYMIEKE